MAMKSPLSVVTALVVAALLISLCSTSLAVFPSRPVVGDDGKPVPAWQFVEQQRLIDGKRYMPGATEKIVVILVEFPADTNDVDTTAIADTCAAVSFQAGHDSAYYDGKIFSETAGSNSMDQYWDECSLGQMDVTGDVYGPYTMPHSMKYYGWDTNGCPGGTLVDDGWSDDAGNTDCLTCAGAGVTGTCRLIKDAVDAADADINYCIYDTDLDWVIDHIIVVHAGKGQELGGSVASHNIWSYFWWGLNYGPYDNAWCAPGVTVGHGCIVPEFYAEPDTFPLGTFAHEFSHSIGNPDLYDPDAGFADVPDFDDYPVSDWCLMDHGSWCGPTGMAERPSHLMGFNKIGTGWVAPTVFRPAQDTLGVLIGELERPGAVVYKIDVSKGEYFLVENRNSASANTYFDKDDSDWSDWTGSGGPDALDCGLIISHIIGAHSLNMSNQQGKCAYDYGIMGDTCTCSYTPYEVWVEDPGYNDSLTTDYDEWWYPWEVKAGAAYAGSGDPHAVFDSVWYWNANCTRTANSNNIALNVTQIYVKATSACQSRMSAEIWIPGWAPPKFEVAGYELCREWMFFHHDKCSLGHTFFGPKPNMAASYNDRMVIEWTAPGETDFRSSPVITNTYAQIGPGDWVTGLSFVAASDGSLYCYAAEDGRRVWARSVTPVLHSTPIACDTLFADDGTHQVMNHVYVNGDDGRIYRFNLLTGGSMGFWEEPFGNALEADPRIAMVEDPGAPGNYVPLIFVGSMGGTMYAIDANAMMDVWDYPTIAPINSPAAVGRIELPMRGSGNLTQGFDMEVIFFGNADGELHCVEAWSGGPYWDMDLGMEIMASPAVCDSVTQTGGGGYSNQIVVAVTVEGKVYALDAEGGGVLWQFDAGDPIASSPSVGVDMVHNWGMVWFQTSMGEVYCLHLGDPPAGNRIIWTYANPDGGTVSSPAVVLPYGMLPLGFDGVGEPVYPPACATGDPEEDGVVYIGTRGGGGSGGSIVALDAADGTRLWHHDTPLRIDASPAPTMGKVFIASDQFYAFAPDPVAGIDVNTRARGGLHLTVGPNPLACPASIEYGVPVADRVSIRVYDTRGRLVATVFSGHRQPGVYRAAWNGKSAAGADVASGIYFIRMDTGWLHMSAKVVVAR
jgi:M6 family metalloprotease-like protein